jgi:hypothetical protein
MEGTLCFLGADGQIYAVAGANGNGPLPVTVTGGSVANPAAGPTGAAVPADADYQGLNVAGVLRGQTGVNPSGAIFAGQVDLASIAGTTTKTGGVAGSLAIGGTSAAATADDGSNPVKIGGMITFTTSAPGQRGNIQISPQGGIGLAANSGGGWGSLAVAGSVSTSGLNALASGIVSVFSSPLPAFSAGQYGVLQMSGNGSLRTLISGTASATKVGLPATSVFPTQDNQTAAVNTLGTSPFTYNGTSLDSVVSIGGAVAQGNTGTGTTAVEETGRPFVNIAGAATTNVKGSKGFLHTVVCNTPVAGSVLTLYDNTVGSGTKVATITIPATPNNPFSVTYDIAFSTGLTAVSTGAADWTISAR